MDYVLNPWPWLAVGLPAGIVAAITMVAYLRRTPERTTPPSHGIANDF